MSARKNYLKLRKDIKENHPMCYSQKSDNMFVFEDGYKRIIFSFVDILRAPYVVSQTWVNNKVISEIHGTDVIYFKATSQVDFYNYGYFSGELHL